MFTRAGVNVVVAPAGRLTMIHRTEAHAQLKRLFLRVPAVRLPLQAEELQPAVPNPGAHLSLMLGGETQPTQNVELMPCGVKEPMPSVTFDVVALMLTQRTEALPIGANRSHVAEQLPSTIGKVDVAVALVMLFTNPAPEQLRHAAWPVPLFLA